jgi:arginase
MSAITAVTLLGVPFDLGAAARGSRLGPEALRLAGLAETLARAGIDAVDGGDVAVGTEASAGTVKNLEAVHATCAAVRDRAFEVLCAGRLPVVLGGDHSIAMGSIAGSARFLRERGEDLGVLWFDAHDDMNTPETGLTGNLHGMPLAVAVGLGEPSLVALAGGVPMVSGSHVAALGLRVVGPGQLGNIRASGIGLSTRRHFDEHGVAAVMDNALRRAGAASGGIHVSFDLDVLDPDHAPGVGSPSPGGLSFTQARLALERVAASGRLMSVDLVELDPTRDRKNVSARVAAELLVALLGSPP